MTVLLTKAVLGRKRSTAAISRGWELPSLQLRSPQGNWTYVMWYPQLLQQASGDSPLLHSVKRMVFLSGRNPVINKWVLWIPVCVSLFDCWHMCYSCQLLAGSGISCKGEGPFLTLCVRYGRSLHLWWEQSCAKWLHSHCTGWADTILLCSLRDFYGCFFFNQFWGEIWCSYDKKQVTPLCSISCEPPSWYDKQGF